MFLLNTTLEESHRTHTMLDATIHARITNQCRELGLGKHTPIIIHGEPSRVALIDHIAAILNLKLSKHTDQGMLLCALSMHEYVLTCMESLVNGQPLPPPSLFGQLSNDELIQLAEKYSVTITITKTPLEKQYIPLLQKYPAALPASRRSFQKLYLAQKKEP